MPARGFGQDHWVNGEYREIVPPERIVWTGTPEHDGNEVLTTVTFAELGGKTKLTLHNAIFESTTARDLHQGGWNSALDCLAEYLATVSASRGRSGDSHGTHRIT
jgi:uncharacterized protein YndB with AHSA1/START domain